MYEHRYLKNNKTLCISAGKCDDQQQYKATLEASMVSTPAHLYENSPISSGPSVSIKQPRVRKSICQFSKMFVVQPNTDILRLFAADQSTIQLDQ